MRERAPPQEKPEEYSEYFEDFSEEVSRYRAILNGNQLDADGAPKLGRTARDAFDRAKA